MTGLMGGGIAAGIVTNILAAPFKAVGNLFAKIPPKGWLIIAAVVAFAIPCIGWYVTLDHKHAVEKQLAQSQDDLKVANANIAKLKQGIIDANNLAAQQKLTIETAQNKVTEAIDEKHQSDLAAALANTRAYERLHNASQSGNANSNSTGEGKTAGPADTSQGNNGSVASSVIPNPDIEECARIYTDRVAVIDWWTKVQQIWKQNQLPASK